MSIRLLIPKFNYISMALDKLDLKILYELVQNSRLSSRELSRRLGVSVGTIELRRKRLEDLGIIKSYTLELDLEKLGYIFPVMIDIKVKGGFLREVESILSKYDNVLSVYDVTGEYDITVLAWFRTRSELDQFIKEVQKIEYVDKTHTRLILNIVAESKKIGFLRLLFNAF